MIRYNLPGTDVTRIFNSSTFPAGEKNIFIKEGDLRFTDDNVFFVVKGAGEIDLMDIGMKVDILRRWDFDKISVVLPYLPYSRQDRYTVQGSSFSLKVFGEFINSLGLHAVYTVDAHSDVCGVINRMVDLSITKCIDFILDRCDVPNMVIVSPDAGAAKKIYKYLGESRYKKDLRVVVASKHRNVETGEITGIEVPEIPYNRGVLVVDDISDGGRTFTELSKKLNNKTKLLFVTHGVFSKPDVFSCYDKVYTTDTIEDSLDYPEVIPLTYRRRIER